MPKIRSLSIENFRSIRSLDWWPAPGINCLVGPGDSGKSTVLDAIDLCLGARRNVAFGDTDFRRLDVTRPITISITLGELPDALLNIEAYGDFLRGCDNELGSIEDEPCDSLETVLTVRLTVEADLEPSWSLVSERAERAGKQRSLAWKDRLLLAPARIGSFAGTNLSWTRGSVLNRLTEERPDLGPQLAEAGRLARQGFGDQANAALGDTLAVAQRVADDLGVKTGGAVKALLDAHAVSLGDGAIALHDDSGVPLRSLGTGSSRLVVAGLQRQAVAAASIALVDEVEYGLEPHRLARLLHSLGAKDPAEPLQVFMTSHSPVALRELTADQVFILRASGRHHSARRIGSLDGIQGLLRSEAEAFLANSVIVCEGASEVGFARGLDQFWTGIGQPSFFALGGAYVDSEGSTPDRGLTQGTALLQLGYRVLAFFDADKPATEDVLRTFHEAGGTSLSWRPGRTLEDELFLSLSYDAIVGLLAQAYDNVGSDTVNEHIRSKSEGTLDLPAVEQEQKKGELSERTRVVLGSAARTKSNGWYKSVAKYERVGKEIVGPALDKSEKGFAGLVESLRVWMHAA